jgi:hypothetical protein
MLGHPDALELFAENRQGVDDLFMHIDVRDFGAFLSRARANRVNQVRDPSG